MKFLIDPSTDGIYHKWPGFFFVTDCGGTKNQSWLFLYLCPCLSLCAAFWGGGELYSYLPPLVLKLPSSLPLQRVSLLESPLRAALLQGSCYTAAARPCKISYSSFSLDRLLHHFTYGAATLYPHRSLVSCCQEVICFNLKHWESVSLLCVFDRMCWISPPLFAAYCCMSAYAHKQ